jgi:hypothetical protein
LKRSGGARFGLEFGVCGKRIRRKQCRGEYQYHAIQAATHHVPSDVTQETRLFSKAGFLELRS